MVGLRRKVARITGLFNETVLYSNKTYYLEEMYSLKGELREAKQISSLAREKLAWANHKVKVLSEGRNFDEFEETTLVASKKRSS